MLKCPLSPPGKMPPLPPYNPPPPLQDIGSGACPATNWRPHQLPPKAKGCQERERGQVSHPPARGLVTSHPLYLYVAGTQVATQSILVI